MSEPVLPLFEKEFLSELEGESKDVDLLDFLMNGQGKSFRESIVEISRYLDKPLRFHKQMKKEKI